MPAGPAGWSCLAFSSHDLPLSFEAGGTSCDQNVHGRHVLRPESPPTPGTTDAGTTDTRGHRRPRAADDRSRRRPCSVPR
ncbi:hypothetical protein NS359_09915 [Curtobacterium oceanosedimentum]|uniref:Uncharacterized protein n=1 Tax=Curtobacterium oceanosedimentum TaxID=465820 RepID=A0A147DPV6_9MICO|nr:hypothetical protein NS359_09915 [Curtobacterium oceanosedimentum]